MDTAILIERAKLEAWSDEEIVSRVLAGETPLFEILMRRYNQRLYRVARAILHDDVEAEDVMQDAYVRAFHHLDQFAGRARFSTWLTRIAVHEALARARRRNRTQELDAMIGFDDSVAFASKVPDPESQLSQQELGRLLEQAILAIPESYRTVLIMRDVEQLTTAEAASCLELSEENVKVRLHRARALVRKELYVRAGAESIAAFQFKDDRCDRVVRNVFSRITNRH